MSNENILKTWHRLFLPIGVDPSLSVPYIDPYSWPRYPRGFDAKANDHMHKIDS